MNLNKIIIAVNMPEETQKPFQYLKAIPFPPQAEIQLVHMITENVYADGMELIQTFPSREEKKKLENQIHIKLQNLKSNLFPEKTKVVTKVLFDSNIRKGFTEYVAIENPDLVIVGTRGRTGMKDLFDSSFAQHQVKYSPANVLILR